MLATWSTCTTLARRLQIRASDDLPVMCGRQRTKLSIAGAIRCDICDRSTASLALKGERCLRHGRPALRSHVGFKLELRTISPLCAGDSGLEDRKVTSQSSKLSNYFILDELNHYFVCHTANCARM